MTTTCELSGCKSDDNVKRVFHIKGGIFNMCKKCRDAYSDAIIVEIPDGEPTNAFNLCLFNNAEDIS